MNPKTLISLAAILWWGFVIVVGLLAAGLIGVNLWVMKKEPPA